MDDLGRVVMSVSTLFSLQNNRDNCPIWCLFMLYLRLHDTWHRNIAKSMLHF